MTGCLIPRASINRSLTQPLSFFTPPPSPSRGTPMATLTHATVCQVKLLLSDITLEVKENAKSAVSLFSPPLQHHHPPSLSPPPPPHPPKRGIIRYMLPVLMGNVISVAHLTVCEVHFFLKSKENDLFSLLFLSDLIGHSTHFPEWHL